MIVDFPSNDHSDFKSVYKNWVIFQAKTQNLSPGDLMWILISVPSIQPVSLKVAEERRG